MAAMSGRERILAAARHQEPDRVPVSPRVGAWLQAEFGDSGLETQLRELPDMDVMHIVGDGTPNYVDACPDAYDLPGVEVEQRQEQEGDLRVIHRTFRTPDGVLSDCVKVAPAGREYGVAPNPFRTEHLVKGPEDLAALRWLLGSLNRDFAAVRQCQQYLGDRGVVMVCIRSALDHNAGYARDMQDLMVDYYENRPFFDALVGLFHERSLERLRAALEGGVEWIFGSWYFNSLSAGWSPAIFEEVFVPQIRDHVELTHACGARYDYYDDGRLHRTMEAIAGAGVDVLETCTPAPVGDFDLECAKRTIGAATTIKGYVDLLYVVKHGTPELVRRTVAEAMEIGKPGGGFIIGSSDSFREGTPRANIEAYFAACRDFGGYR